jgi:hypothetical protein
MNVCPSASGMIVLEEFNSVSLRLHASKKRPTQVCMQLEILEWRFGKLMKYFDVLRSATISLKDF